MNTRDKILESALHLFDEKGYHQTSIQEISEGAGVSKGGFFHYFPSKNDILFALQESFCIDSHLNNIEKVALNDDLSPAEKLHKLIDYEVYTHVKNRPNVVIFYHGLKNLSEDKIKIIKEKRDRYEEIFRKVIRQGIERGDFKDDFDINIVSKALFGMCNWTYMWLDPEGPMTPGQISDTFSKLFIDGLHKKREA